MALPTGLDVRLAARTNSSLSTSGLAPNYTQANLMVLPLRYAQDFRLLCARNPVPYPLIAESEGPGIYDRLKYHLYVRRNESIRTDADIDLRTDAARFNVYHNGAVERKDERRCWYSFETALASAGLTPPHMVLGRVVPMYRTQLLLHPAGVFSDSTVVVSMRHYRISDIDAVRTITRPYVLTHGEPLAWGWSALKRLGITDVNLPTWGDAPVTLTGEPLETGDEEHVPVFWGCGVTPQEAVMRAQLSGTVIGHSPGHMVVLDLQDKDLLLV